MMPRPLLQLVSRRALLLQPGHVEQEGSCADVPVAPEDPISFMAIEESIRIGGLSGSMQRLVSYFSCAVSVRGECVHPFNLCSDLN